MVSEQSILMPEHSNRAIFENAKLRAKSVAAIMRGQRDQLLGIGSAVRF